MLVKIRKGSVTMLEDDEITTGDIQEYTKKTKENCPPFRRKHTNRHEMDDYFQNGFI